MIKKSFKLFSFKRNYKKHWERVYKKTSPIDLGWYQPYPDLSLKLINSTRVGVDGSIIDVGCGTSELSRLLLNQGYRRLTVLDISAHAIEKVILCLGELSKKITWIEADVTNFKFVEKFDVWHDRAVFHFLTDPFDRKKYVDSAIEALKPNGNLIIATFGLDAPPKCSGLDVIRYSPKTLSNEFGNKFEFLQTIEQIHITPSKVPQPFIYCHFKRTM